MCMYPVNIARLQSNGHERCWQDDVPIQEIERLYSNWVSIVFYGCLLRNSLLCSLRIYLTTFDAGLVIQFGAYLVRYLFNKINYPPAKIIFKCLHLS